MGELVRPQFNAEIAGVQGNGRYYYLVVEIDGALRIRCARAPVDTLTQTYPTQINMRDVIHVRLWSTFIESTSGEAQMERLGGGYFVLGEEQVIIAGSSIYGREQGRERVAKALRRAYPGYRVFVVS